MAAFEAPMMWMRASLLRQTQRTLILQVATIRCAVLCFAPGRRAARLHSGRGGTWRRLGSTFWRDATSLKRGFDSNGARAPRPSDAAFIHPENRRRFDAFRISFLLESNGVADSPVRSVASCGRRRRELATAPVGAVRTRAAAAVTAAGAARDGTAYCCCCCCCC